MTPSKAPRHWSGTQPVGRLRATAKSLPEQARTHNRHLVLRTLFHADALSRAEIARVTHLTAGTTSTLVRELADEGLIVEQSPEHSQRPGKPRTPLSLNPAAYEIVGIDLSDPEDVRGAVMDLRGGIQARESADAGQGDALRTVLDLGRRLVGRASRPILGIGVSCPGIVTPHGDVLLSTTYGWEDVPLARLLGQGLERPVTVANDANAATLAEFTFGGAPSDGLVAVTIGRGVGAGLMLGGILVQGDGFSVGEIGHVTAVEDGAACECGRRGCLQTVVSAPVLRALNNGPDPAAAAERCAAVGARLGTVLAPLVGALALREIRVSAHSGLLRREFLEAMETTIRARVLPTGDSPVHVLEARLGADAQVVGAAALVLSAQLGIA